MTIRDGRTPFEELLSLSEDRKGDASWRDAIIDVADTAYHARTWLSTYAPGHTAADILTMTQMMLDQRILTKQGELPE